jgi:hypothetical protein
MSRMDEYNWFFFLPSFRDNSTFGLLCVSRALWYASRAIIADVWYESTLRLYFMHGWYRMMSMHDHSWFFFFILVGQRIALCLFWMSCYRV